MGVSLRASAVSSSALTPLHVRLRRAAFLGEGGFPGALRGVPRIRNMGGCLQPVALCPRVVLSWSIGQMGVSLASSDVEWVLKPLRRALLAPMTVFHRFHISPGRALQLTPQSNHNTNYQQTRYNMVAARWLSYGV